MAATAPFRIVIPARYASTRLPAKPLAHICGTGRDGRTGACLQVQRCAVLRHLTVQKKKAETGPYSMMKTVEREEARKSNQAEYAA